MNAARILLTPRAKLELADPGDAIATSLLRQAILSRTCVLAAYNRGAVKLAPHVLYRRDGALFVDAVTVERDGRAPVEPKLGAFRLSGLGDLRSTGEQFVAQPDVQTDEPRYAGGILARVQPIARHRRSIISQGRAAR